MQMSEKVGKSRNTVFFQWFVAPDGRKVGSLKRRVRSQLARWEMKNCTPLWREAHVEVKMHKTHHDRSTFGSWDAEKVHAVVARSTFRSQNAQNTMLGPLLEVEISNKCTPLWGEAHFEAKMLKTPGVRTTFGGSDVASLRFTTLHSTTLHYTTLHYTTLHYTTLHYTTLHNTTTTTTQLHNYTPPHSTTRNYIALHYITLHYAPTPLHYITLHHTTLPSTTLHYITLHSTTLQLQLRLHNYTPLHSTSLNYTTLQYIILHYTTFHYTPLHYITLHYITLNDTCTTDRQVDR